MRNADDLERLHERILEAARGVVRAKRRNEFTVKEIARLLRVDCPEFSENAIRTDVISRCRQSAPGQNTAIHGDFERIRYGAYRLLSASDNSEKFGEPGVKRTQSRIEKHGEYGSCEVAAWRYEGDSVWHVKVWADNRDVRRNKYTVMSGMFEPEAASQAEQEAVLSLIAKWESELATIRSRPGSPPGQRFGRLT